MTRPRTPLTPETVQHLISVCLLRPEESVTEAIDVEGLLRDYRFHKDRVTENASAIGDLLAELPDQFQAKGGGGGWSFLNACHDRHHNQWTGLHQRMEELVCLGIAVGKAEWMTRELADALPGGMPYFRVL